MENKSSHRHLKNIIQLNPIVRALIPTIGLSMLVMSCVSYRALSTKQLIRDLAKKPDSISVGNIVNITLKDETIEKLKVTAMDSTRIAGVQSIVADGHMTHKIRIVKRSDIQNVLKPSLLVPGNVVKIKMNDGEMIKMKVKELNSVEIIGTQISPNSQGQIYFPKTLLIADMKEIKKRGFSPLKTIALVVLPPALFTLAIFIVIDSIQHP